jgi:CRISPR-associated endonuclease Cas1
MTAVITSASPRPEALPLLRSGVLILTGYGLRIVVERGHLITQDGIGTQRRQLRIPRVGSGLRRVIIAGHGGTVSLDALHWIADVKAAFIQLNADGDVVTVGAAAQLNDVRLRRRQALAGNNAVGLSLAKRFIGEKISGHVKVLRHLPHGEQLIPALEAMLLLVKQARTIDRVRYVEARAAAAYWTCWEQVPVPFPKREITKIPNHWLRVGPRRSGISQGPIKATTPAHALLNYLYAVVEAEAALALRAVGCDPALGVLHVDGTTRDSMACDLMESVRPFVDAFVLRILRERVFLKSDFFERHDGNCRLMPTLTGALSATGPEWGERLAPFAEELATLLRETPPRPLDEQADDPLPQWVPRLIRTPLTGHNRATRRFRPTLGTRVPDLALLPLGRRCLACGLDMGFRERAYCDDCRAENQTRLTPASPQAQRAVRVTDGRSRPEVRAIHRVQTAQQMVRQRAWEREHGGRPSADSFHRDIAPRLKMLPVESLADATGLSVTFCKAIRAGRGVPHPMHWAALRRLAERALAESNPPIDLTRIDQSYWRREIKPYLRSLGTSEIARVTGLSVSYARRVRSGHHIPRPTHWQALLKAIGKGRETASRR